MPKYQLARAAALQLVAVRLLTGNDVSGHYLHHFFVSSFVLFVSPLRTFLIEGVLLQSKNLISKSCSNHPITSPDPVRHFRAPCRPFGYKIHADPIFSPNLFPRENLNMVPRPLYKAGVYKVHGTLIFFPQPWKLEIFPRLENLTRLISIVSKPIKIVSVLLLHFC